MFPPDVDIPMWLIIAFSVAYVTWPLLVLSGCTAIVALIAAAAKSVLALKVAAVAGAVFFSPVVIGVVGAPVLKLIEQISYGVSGSDSVLLFSEWKENTPLIRAVKKQNEKKIEKLLEKGADVNELSKNNQRTPLSQSCKAYADEEKADRITARLLKAGADANKKMWEADAMKNAIAAHRHGAMRLLCAHGYKMAKDDGTGSGIVEYAVQAQRYEEAALLLELGAVPCDRYDYGFLREDHTTFMYILEEPRFYKESDTWGNAEEETARFEKNVADLSRLFALLVEKGADVDARTSDHWKHTALLRLAWSYATTRNDAPKLPLAKILLDAGADVNAADAYGKTALHYFAEISWATDLDDVVNAIRLFASYNPDLTLRDEKGNTPLDTFLRYCHDDDRERYPEAYAEIVRLLTPAAPKRESPKTSEIRTGENVIVAKAEESPHIEIDDMSDDW